MSLADLDGATRLAAIATAENPTSKDWFKVGGPAAVPAVHPGPLQSVIRCLPCCAAVVRRLQVWQAPLPHSWRDGLLEFHEPR